MAKKPKPAPPVVGPPAIPPTGTCYHGETIRPWDALDPQYGDSRPFATRFADTVQVEMANKKPSIVGLPTIWEYYAGAPAPFGDLLWQVKAVAALSPATIPFISWNSQTGWASESASYAGITTQTIASGKLDSYIASFADAVKAYGKPLFIRPIAGEINGAWWHHASPRANAALSIADFVSAWRRVFQIFQARGVTNVAWVWNCYTFPPPPADWGFDTNCADYYPGDAYVDWVGADHYDEGPPSYLDPHVAFALAHGKPFFLAEWGIRLGTLTPPEQQAWISAMFDYLDAHPVIKAMVYFNYNMNSAGQDLSTHTVLYGGAVNYAPHVNNNDSRLLAESGAALRSTYASRIAHARYS